VRGSYAFKSVIKTLKYEHNMKNAEDIMLVGTSAGALGVMHQCANLEYDSDANIGCIMDAGFFYDATNFAGEVGIQTEYWKGVAKTHYAEGWMDGVCERKEEDPNSCFIAGNALQYIEAPIFLVQSSTDYWQLLKNYFYNVTDGIECLKDPIRGCTPQTFNGIQEYHMQTLKALEEAAGENDYVSWFVDSCFAHSQVDTDKLFALTAINGTTISEALKRWFNSSSGDVLNTRTVDPMEWPHDGQECGWGPEWDVFIANHSQSLEFGDLVDTEDDGYLKDVQSGSAADSSGHEDTTHSESQAATSASEDSSVDGSGDGGGKVSKGERANKASKGEKASKKGTKSKSATKSTKESKSVKSTAGSAHSAVEAAPESSPAVASSSTTSSSSSGIQTPSHEAMPSAPESMPGLEEAYEMIEALSAFDSI